MRDNGGGARMTDLAHLDWQQDSLRTRAINALMAREDSGYEEQWQAAQNLSVEILGQGLPEFVKVDLQTEQTSWSVEGLHFRTHWARSGNTGELKLFVKVNGTWTPISDLADLGQQLRKMPDNESETAA